MKYELEEIAHICSGEFYGHNVTVCSAVTDSRSYAIDSHSVFVAIHTDSRDGHDFVGEAYARGVRAFILERKPDVAQYPQAGFVVVGSSVDALQTLAAHHRASFKGKVVAVTGSYGKTVVKEWIAQLAPEGVKVFRSPKSYNSQIGVPLSILMISGDEQFAVIEAGISRSNEMQRLAEIIRPDVGVFTVLGAAHDENFADRKSKLAEKLKLFKACPRVVYNSHCEGVGEALSTLCKDAKLIDAACLHEVYSRIDERIWADDAAEAVAVYQALGYPTADVMTRVAELQPVATRLELKEGINSSLVINDSYNFDVNSLGIALDYLHRVAGGRPQTVILSDIADSDYSVSELYTRAAEELSRADLEKIICIGEEISRSGAFGALSCDVKCFLTVDEYLRSMRVDDIAGRVILVKGSPKSGFDKIVHSLSRKSHTTTLEVDLDSMIRNLKIYRSHLRSGVKLTAMVKAMSYGHGTYEIASALQQQGVDYLAVAFADEGVTLREGGITMPIVVLNADADSFDIMVRHHLEPEIYSFRSLADFADTVRSQGETTFPIHLKVDSGMHRLGFRMEDVPGLLQMLDAQKQYVRVSTAFSHLCVADEPEQDDFTRSQIAYFDHLTLAVQSGLGYHITRHIDNTAGMIRFPEAQFDMCRLGVGLYGFGFQIEGLRPISTLKTRIVRLATLHKGDTVGYGRQGVIERDSVIATIPIGYADGLNRRLGCGHWSMRVAGGKAPIVGRVCMDSCMIDVTDIAGVAEGDEVVIFSPEKSNTVEDMAEVLGTICYEVMTSVSSRVKRIYTKE